MKVLVVEDEERLGRMLKKSLSEHAHIVNSVSTCAAANDAIVETSYDLIVVDLGLPDGDGLALVREWRECGFTEPILILSARDSREDRVRGLDVGADDYLPKPFGMDELLARMRALLRRQAARKQTVYEHNGITLDLLAHVVRVRLPTRTHRSRICADDDLCAECGSSSDAITDRREDLGFPFRRRYQSDRCLHEPATVQSRRGSRQAGVQDDPWNWIPTPLRSIGAGLTIWIRTSAHRSVSRF